MAGLYEALRIALTPGAIFTRRTLLQATWQGFRAGTVDGRVARLLTGGYPVDFYFRNAADVGAWSISDNGDHKPYFVSDGNDTEGSPIGHLEAVCSSNGLVARLAAPYDTMCAIRDGVNDGLVNTIRIVHTPKGSEHFCGVQLNTGRGGMFHSFNLTASDVGKRTTSEVNLASSTGWFKVSAEGDHKFIGDPIDEAEFFLRTACINVVYFRAESKGATGGEPEVTKFYNMRAYKKYSLDLPLTLRNA